MFSSSNERNSGASWWPNCLCSFFIFIASWKWRVQRTGKEERYSQSNWWRKTTTAWAGRLCLYLSVYFTGKLDIFRTTATLLFHTQFVVVTLICSGGGSKDSYVVQRWCFYYLLRSELGLMHIAWVNTKSENELVISKNGLFETDVTDWVPRRVGCNVNDGTCDWVNKHD